MDPLSISAGIVGFLTFLKDAAEIIGDIKGFPEDRRLILARFAILRDSLLSVKSRVDQVKDVEDELQKGNAFGRRSSTSSKLFQRYHEAVRPPDGLYVKVELQLKELQADEFFKGGRKRDRFTWTFKKDDIKAKIDAAVELVGLLRNYLQDDDVQLHQQHYIETVKIRRTHDETEAVNLLDWISPSGQQPTDVVASKYSTILRLPDPFILSSPVYKQWVQDAGSKNWHLNCFGKPGAGKSHRSRSVIFDLYDKFHRDGVPVLFVLFEQSKESQQSLRAVYRRLLRQLLSQCQTDEIPKEVRQLWDRARLDGRDGPSEAEAKELLIDQLKKYPRKFIIADALDEAKGCESVIHHALSTLRNNAQACIFSTTRMDPQEKYETVMCNKCSKDAHHLYWSCKLCRSGHRIDICRECYQDKGERCNDSTHIMQIADRVNIEVLPTPQEIESFVSSSLKQELNMDDSGADDEAICLGFEPPLKSISREFGDDWQLIPKKVSMVAIDSYLIADLIVKRLKSQKHFDGAKKIVDSLQADANHSYDQQYNEMLNLCLNNKDRESYQVAYNHLAFVTCARDVLSFQQLSHAVAIQPNARSISDIVRRCSSRQTVLRETNGLLLIGDFGNPEDLPVTFFHRTLADYLKERGEDWFPGADQAMFDACMAYLQLDIFKQPFKKLKDLDKALAEYPFASYSAVWWGEHLRRAPLRNENIVPVLELLNDQDRKATVTQIAIHVSSNADLAWDVQQGFSPLHICAFNGLVDICSILLGDGEDINCLEESYGQTPLHFACRRGHHEVVRLLLMENANPNIVSRRENTPLMDAIENGHEEVVDLLLQYPSVDVNADSGGTRKNTALIFAAQKGKVNMVRRLLEHSKIQVNQTDAVGMSPLTWAVKAPSVACVDLLLQRTEIDVTISDPRVGTPLEYVALQSHGFIDEAIVKLFLRKKGTPVLGGSSLQFLVETHRNDLLTLFLREQDYSGWKDTHERSLLHIAAYCGNMKSVELAYDHLSASGNFDINSKDAYGWTALHAACYRYDAGGGRLARYLLQKGAAPDAKNDKDETPVDVAFQNASSSLHDTVSQVFLPYLPQGMGSTNQNPAIPLDRIIFRADLDQLEAAIQHESTPLPLVRDPYTGWTVLHRTMFTRHGPKPDLLEVLLPKMLPYVDEADNSGRTCLHEAVMRGSRAAVQLLIDAGAKLDVEDKWGDTAFDIAQRNPQSKSLAFLLMTGGTRLRTDKLQRDLINEAVKEGDIDIVKALVKVGVDVYYRPNGRGPTALMLARKLHRAKFVEVRYTMANNGQWLNSNDPVSFDKAIRDDPRVRPYQDIIECLQAAPRVDTRRRLVYRDLSSLIDRLRVYEDPGPFNRVDSKMSTSPYSRKGSETLPPPPYSAAYRSMSDPRLTMTRSRSNTPPTDVKTSAVKIDNPNIQGSYITVLANMQVQSLAILVAGVVACVWLILNFILQIVQAKQGMRSEL